MIQVCLSEKISTIFNYKFTKMLEKIIAFSLKNKLIILLFTLGVVGFGLFSVF